MIVNILNRANQTLLASTQVMNRAVQRVDKERRSLGAMEVADSMSAGKVLDMGVKCMAHAAQGERYIAMWFVGRGVKDTEVGYTAAGLRLQIKQNGLLGCALRHSFAQIGRVCGVSADKNSGLFLADAALAALRLLVITLPQATLVALAFFVFSVAQLAVDGGLALAWLAQRSLQSLPKGSGPAA